MKIYRYFLLTFIIIVIDQASKMLVHFNMEMGVFGEINVIGNWFRLHYLLNPGMAFGIKWESEFGKLALTLFRLLAMTGISIYMVHMAKKSIHPGFLWSMALILGGAIGNVIDSTFYGILLDNAPPDAPIKLFHGQVIDMLFFPLIDFHWPEWMPFVGGQYFLFFSPVFNIADASIFIGVSIILIFQKRFFPSAEKPEEKQAETSIISPIEDSAEVNSADNKTEN